MISVLLLLAPPRLFAQDQQSGSDDSIDNLFNGSGETSPSSSPPDPVPPSAAARPDDITHDTRLHFFGSGNVYGDIGGGWSPLPDFSQPFANLGYEAAGAFQASLGFEVRPTPEFRLRGTLTYTFPNPLPMFSELILDYSILNAVFFRLGIFGYTWGNSQFFLFANLPSRVPAGAVQSTLPLWETTTLLINTVITNPPVSVKVNFPFGLNGLTLLVRFDMQNYGFVNQQTPNFGSAGYGAQWEMVTGPIEWGVGGFYQRLLTPRGMLSMKTSLLGFDLSAETTMAFPFSSSTTGGGIYVGGPMQRIYPTAVVGLSREWSDAHIKLYAEYAYNGERAPGVSWLPDESGPGGHNSVIGLRFMNLGPAGLAFNVLWQQNWSDGSALVAPFFELSPLPLTSIQIGIPLVLGPDGSEVLNNRLVPGTRRLELLLLVKISASFQQ